MDGCRIGWFFVRGGSGPLTFGAVSKLAGLIADMPGYAEARVFVDIPIGLRDLSATPRSCDVEARRRLGPGRASSVFPPPLRALLGQSSYASALERSRKLCGKGLSKQAFAILPKIREVDDLLAESGRARAIVREVHPELCFWAFGGGKPMAHGKKKGEGFCERMEVLERVLPGSSDLANAALARYRRSDVARDDIVDALVLAATASAPDGALRTVPGIPEYDSRRLPMEMVYPAINLSEAR